jgi:hypothetical protein
MPARINKARLAAELPSELHNDSDTARSMVVCCESPLFIVFAGTHCAHQPPVACCGAAPEQLQDEGGAMRAPSARIELADEPQQRLGGSSEVGLCRERAGCRV